jgi:thiamine biosynthesis lipoprotein
VLSLPEEFKIQRARPALGTLVLIRAIGPASARIHSGIDAAFTVVEEIDQCMSAHRVDNDLHRLAGARRGEVITLDVHTLCVLREAKRWFQLSDGAFDPLRAGQQLASRGLRPGLEVALSLPMGRWSALEFMSQDQVLVDGAMPVDLGGIAKGYAVDQAVAALQRAGVEAGLVNAGGDLRAFGLRSWPLALRVPAAPSLSGIHPDLRRIKQGAVASSAQVTPSQCQIHTRIRRRIGVDAQGVQACTVLAPNCLVADALTKWALGCPPGGAPMHRLRRVARQHGARVWQL